MVFTEKQEFKHSFCLSADTYNGFISVFKDKNPLHTDDAFAVSKGFQGKVMHGNILNGFLSFFVGELLPVKNVIIHSQQIQFKQPVYLDTTLEFRAIVSGVFESVKAVEFSFAFRNQENTIVSKGTIQIGLI